MNLMDLYQQAPGIFIIVAMFYFVVYSVATALLAYWMHRDGKSRKIENITWWVGTFLILSFVLGLPLSNLPGMIVVIIYLIYRAGFETSGINGRGGRSDGEGEGQTKGTVIIRNYEASPAGRLLVVKSPDPRDLGLQLPLRQGQTSLGVSLENDLAFTGDSSISRRHCQLRETMDGERRTWELTDAGSSNGTRVWNPGINEFEKLTRPVSMRHGDRFACGATEFELVIY